jgi:hypothetical protein
MSAWRDVIRRFDAEFGAGAAGRELAIGALVLAVGAVNLLGFALVLSGGGHG